MPAAPELSAADPNASRTPARLPPAAAMYGEASVARGVLVDDTGAPIPRAEILGRGIRVSHRTFIDIEGYARGGVFVFRYSPSPWHGWPPGLKMTFLVETPGFVQEAFRVEPEVAAALWRGDSVEGLTIVLQRGATVEGTVLGPGGTPADGVEVGVVDDPLVLRSELLTRVTTDEHGRFRLIDLDPRRRLWIHARSDKLLARPLPLATLCADTVTHRTIALTRIRMVTVRFEIVATDRNVSICIDNNHTHRIDAGEFRVRLESGPHRCEFKNAKDEVVKSMRFRIEPHQREHYELVLLGDCSGPGAHATSRMPIPGQSPSSSLCRSRR